MSEGAIPFGGQMVRATMLGMKTNTRRTRGLDVVNMQPERWRLWHPEQDEEGVATFANGNDQVLRVCCPYGVPGDRLWVREGLQKAVYSGELAVAHYAADDQVVIDAEGCARTWNWKLDSLPGIYMPRWASRLTLEIQTVRMERVREISYADALAEGVWRPGPDADPDQVDRAYDAREQFHRLWDEINEARGFGWYVNPWVWVIGYKPV